MKNVIKIIVKIVFVIIFFIITFVPVAIFIQNSPDWFPFRSYLIRSLLRVVFMISIPILTAFVSFKTITSIINGIYEKKKEGIVWGIIIYTAYFLTFLFLAGITFPMM